MAMSTDPLFSGPIPAVYDEYLGPMLFAPYAADLCGRIDPDRTSSLLEVASGTGIVTRAFAESLPDTIDIVATDLSPAMIEFALERGTARPVTWRQADACALPFPDGSFDAVVCQFGMMFPPDHGLAFREARRVLRDGGTFLFNMWGPLDRNDFASVVVETLDGALGDRAPTAFVVDQVHGHHDEGRIAADLAVAGFLGRSVTFEIVDGLSRAESASIPATGFCHGTPMRPGIEAQGAGVLDEVTWAVAAAIARKHGAGEIEGHMSALVVTATKE